MYIHIYIYTHVCMYVYIYIYTYIHIAAGQLRVGAEPGAGRAAARVPGHHDNDSTDNTNNTNNIILSNDTIKHTNTNR